MQIRKSVTALLAVVFVVLTYLFTPGPNPIPKKIFLDKGSRMMISEQLYQNEVIREKYSFWFLSQMLRIFGPMQSGEYLFQPGEILFSVVKKIQSADVVDYSITIPEGLYISEILSIINSNDDLEGDIKLQYSEGSLMPSTYHFNYGYTRDSLIKRMNLELERFLDKSWEGREKDLPLKSKFQALILASIVEKEAMYSDEKAKIAAVFINRLNKGMKIQSDPTTIYAITNGKYSLKRPLNRKDLKIASPYNTYEVYGLPPSPICNPGKESIEAVMHPLKTKEIYFVLNETGRHSFSKSYKEHLKNVAEYKKFLLKVN